MPVPKRKRSRPRRDKRFANKGMKVKAIALCPSQGCGASLMPHIACTNCGYYKGSKVLITKAERAEKRGELKRLRTAQEAA